MSWVPGYTDTGGGSGPDYGGIFPPWDQGGTPPATSPGYPPEGAPPNTPFPGSPPSQPYPDVPYGPPAPEPQQPPPSDPYIAPSGWSGDLSPFFAGIGGAFFRRGRARTLPSPFETAVRTGIDAVFRNTRSYFSRPPPILSESKALSTQVIERFGLGRWATRLIGGPILAIGLEAFLPNELGSGELRSPVDRLLPQRMDPRLGFGGNPVIRELPLSFQTPGRVRRPYEPKIGLDAVLPPEVEPEVQERGRRGLGGLLEDLARNAVRQALPTPLREYVPRSSIDGPIAPAKPATPAAPATVKQQTIGTRSTTGKAPRSAPRAGRIFTFGGIGTAVLLLEAARRGRSQSPLVGGAVPPVLNPIVTPPVVTPLTPLVPSVQSYSPYYAGGGGDAGYCTPKPRGPRRKCLERAPVKYSGGRRKGKAAGTKCLRWEAPKR